MENLKLAFSFNGIAARSEYWAMLLLTFISTVIALLLLENTPFLALVLFVFIAWYSISTTVRRIRDAGLNMLWVIAVFVPYVGTIFSIVLGCLKSEPLILKESDRVEGEQ
jgi:uncharacterized membrane protein YhaH (DUF805 family)